jgi:cyclopropane-fatty-acyl-phospholipid synthase
MRWLNSMLSRFVRCGTLRVIDAHGKVHAYRGTPGPEVTIRVTDPKLAGSLFLNPELRAGEAYMDGTLVVEEGGIRGLLLLFALNRENLREQPLYRCLSRARGARPCGPPLRSLQ